MTLGGVAVAAAGCAMARRATKGIATVALTSARRVSRFGCCCIFSPFAGGSLPVRRLWGQLVRVGVNERNLQTEGRGEAAADALAPALQVGGVVGAVRVAV